MNGTQIACTHNAFVCGGLGGDGSGDVGNCVAYGIAGNSVV